MPIYEFLCKSCGHEFEELVLVSNKKIECPECGSRNLGKEFSTFGVGSAAPAGSCGTMSDRSCCGTGTCPGCPNDMA